MRLCHELDAEIIYILLKVELWAIKIEWVNWLQKKIAEKAVWYYL